MQIWDGMHIWEFGIIEIERKNEFKGYYTFSI